MKKHCNDETGYKRGEMDRPDSPATPPASTAPKNPGVGGAEKPGNGGGGKGGMHTAGGKY